MTAVATREVLAIEAQEMLPPVAAIRAAFAQRMATDLTLVTLLGGARVYYRPMKKEVEVPSVTYFDFGMRPDNRVPLIDRTVQVDIWETQVLRAEKISDRVQRLFDLQPLPLPTLEARVDFVRLTADRDEVLDDGRVVRKSLDFRVLAYALI